LGIPVIVGAKKAMEALKTESIVTVDANRGVVYSGKANII
jgi:pyruvate kinase